MRLTGYISFVLNGGKSSYSLLASDLHLVSVSDDGRRLELLFTYPGDDGEEDLAPPVTVRTIGHNLGIVAQALRAGDCPELVEKLQDAAGDRAAPSIEAIEGLDDDWPPQP